MPPGCPTSSSASSRCRPPTSIGPTIREPGPIAAKPPRRARSRSRPGPAAWARSGPASSSPTATSSRTPMWSPARTPTPSGSRTPAAGSSMPRRSCSTSPRHRPAAGAEARPAGPPFASADPPRGAIAAALGYPGGGPLTILPAAVTGDTRPPAWTSTATRGSAATSWNSGRASNAATAAARSSSRMGRSVAWCSRSRGPTRTSATPCRRSPWRRGRAGDRPDDARRHRGLPALSLAPYT